MLVDRRNFLCGRAGFAGASALAGCATQSGLSDAESSVHAGMSEVAETESFSIRVFFLPLKTLLLSMMLALGLLQSACTYAPSEEVNPAGVQITETRESYTLSNGIVSAVISKRNGDILAFSYLGDETLSPRSGSHSAGYWSHDPTGGVALIPRISVDPDTNEGTVGEVSIKGISGGRKMGHGPGTPIDGDLALDVDIRWAMKAGDAGIYTYTAFDHRPDYPSGVMAEARIAVELDKKFDHIHADDARSGKFPLLNEGVDKYVYVALQAEERTYGWTSPEEKLGWFLLNPSAEYLSGGPTKVEFLVHGAPTVLNYWKSSHYYGANVTLADGEDWQRVIGPFKFQVVEGESHAEMVEMAKAELAKEEAAWPFEWVDAEGYTPPAERGVVSGRIDLTTTDQPGTLHVGLTKTPYSFTTDFGAEREIEWQNDGKYYQFWAISDEVDGSFEIEDVPPGTYSLHAYVEGIPGEYSETDIVVDGQGKTTKLGVLNWVPKSFGKTVWQIGTPDKSGAEFHLGDRYFEPGIQLRFSEKFSGGLRYETANAEASDWFFTQAPTAIEGRDYEVRAFVGIVGEGEATPYDIAFDLDDQPTGFATLRLGLTSVTSPVLNVAVNGVEVPGFSFKLADHALVRHQMYGRWLETWTSFDASLLKAGMNEITLTIPAGEMNNSVVYDFVRLELDEAAREPPAAHEPKPRRPRRPVPPPPEVQAYEVRTFHDDARFGLTSDDEPVLTSEGGKLYFKKPGMESVLISNEDIELGPWAVSPDENFLAYMLKDPSREGYDIIRFFDLKTGRAVADELLYVQSSVLDWRTDSSGIYYSKRRDPFEDEERQRFNTAQSVYFHKIGTDRLADKRVYGSDRGRMIHYAETSDDGEWLIVNASVSGNGRSEIVLLNLTEQVPGPFKAIRTMADNWQFAGSKDGQLFFVTTEGAPNRRLVSMNTTNPSLPLTDIVPETDRKLEMARLEGGVFRLAYDVEGKIETEMAAVPE